MRIVVLSESWEPENGVVQRRWKWISDLLLRQGHQLLVVTPSPHYHKPITVREWWTRELFRSRIDQSLSTDQTRVIRTGFFPSGTSISGKILNQGFVAWGMLVVLFRKYRFFRKYNPDIVIGTVPALPTAMVAAVYSVVLRSKLLIDLRDPWPQLMDYSDHWNRALGPKTKRERVLRLLAPMLKGSVTRILNKILECCDGVIVTTASLKANLVDSNQKPEDKVALIRNVFPNNASIKQRERPTCNQQERPLRILYSGTVGRAQNLANALVAGRLAMDMGAPVEFRIVGTGAAVDHLQNKFGELRPLVEFFGQEKVEELSRHYEWADTALVHLTDWEPLQMAVPSKTYELMEHSIHITAVVKGEVAKLITDLGAGTAVTPESPRKLAEHFANLYWMLIGQGYIEVADHKAADWVRFQRENVAPQALRKLLRVLND